MENKSVGVKMREKALLHLFRKCTRVCAKKCAWSCSCCHCDTKFVSLSVFSISLFLCFLLLYFARERGSNHRGLFLPFSIASDTGTAQPIIDCFVDYRTIQNHTTFSTMFVLQCFHHQKKKRSCLEWLIIFFVIFLGWPEHSLDECQQHKWKTILLYFVSKFSSKNENLFRWGFM
jgi:hypothetical protein